MPFSLLAPPHRLLRSQCPATAHPLGWILFQLGLFLLASSALLGEVLLGLALILGFRGRRPLTSDPWNWPLLAAALLMLLGAFHAYSGWLAWVGLPNWLPFFVGFWAYQAYLSSPEARRRSAQWLVAGTVPVVVTGFGQLWWGWQGPWELFSGLMRWDMLPGGSPVGRMAGLFDYANISGAWLALAWPLALACLFQPRLRWPRRCLVLAIVVGILVAVYYSESRNAWGALLLALPIVSGPARWPLLLPPLLLAVLVLSLASLPGVPLVLQGPARMVVPDEIWRRLSDAKYAASRQLSSTRLGQWGFCLELIRERPWLGWGAAAFSVIYPLRRGVWHGHPHNLPIELAVSFGLPVAILLVGQVLALLIGAAWRGMASGPRLFDRAWWAAALVVTSLHGTDLPFYNSRINVAGWVLLAGLRCAIAAGSSPTATPDRDRPTLGPAAGPVG
ncbi:MAG: O-antigen ligase family protein [Synechococcaceae cyanobacterium]